VRFQGFGPRLGSRGETALPPHPGAARRPSHPARPAGAGGCDAVRGRRGRPDELRCLPGGHSARGSGVRQRVPGGAGARPRRCAVCAGRNAGLVRRSRHPSLRLPSVAGFPAAALILSVRNRTQHTFTTEISHETTDPGGPAVAIRIRCPGRGCCLLRRRSVLRRRAMLRLAA